MRVSEIEVKFNISPKFKHLLKNKTRWEVLKGGAGSGKSHNTALKLVYRAITEPKHRMLILRKVGRTIRESVFELAKQVISDTGLPESLYKVNKSDMTITFLHNNSKLIFSGLDDPEKIKSIAGITNIWAEEATEFTQDDIEQLNLRLRPNRNDISPQIILTLNPISSTHWIKKRFFDKKQDNVLIHESTYKDNPYLPKEYVEALESLKNTNYSYYKIYALGEWGSLKGLIYPDYKIIDTLPQYAELHTLGLDFGYNHPQALLEIKIDKNNIYVDEVYYKSGKTNAQMLEELKGSRSELFKIECFADSARPDLIQECEDTGMLIEPANKAVFAGINMVKSYNLYVTSRSVNVIKELDSYVWKLDKDGNSLDEPIKINDDAMDALRYGVFTPLSQANSHKSISLKVKGL